MQNILAQLFCMYFAHLFAILGEMFLYCRFFAYFCEQKESQTN